uniref:Uncharacterized protein n=1 Tax=Strigamia maritima TaxID=126957 RepID=T1J809_STRMM
MKLLKLLISAYLICFSINYVNCKLQMKEIVNHLTWNLIKCDSSEILWSLKNCLNVVKTHITVSDNKNGCLFLHYISSCAKQMKSKAAECEKKSKLDKSLDLETLEFLYSASYMLCKSNMAEMKRIYSPPQCGQLLLSTMMNKIEAAIEMEHFVPKQAFDGKNYVCSKLREFQEVGNKGNGCNARILKRNAQHMHDNILKCHLPYIMRRKEFSFSDYDVQQDDSFFQQFTAVQTTTTTTDKEQNSRKPESATSDLDPNENLVKAVDVAINNRNGSKILGVLSEIINAIIIEFLNKNLVLTRSNYSLEIANFLNENSEKVGIAKLEKVLDVKENSIISTKSSALIQGNFSEKMKENIKENEESQDEVDTHKVGSPETKYVNDSQNGNLKEEVIQHRKTQDGNSTTNDTSSPSTPNATSTSTSTSVGSSTIIATSTPSTTPSSTAVSSTHSTTITSSIPSTTITSSIPSTTPSTTITSSIPSTITSSTPSTTITSSIPSTTITSSIPSTTITSSIPSTTITSSIPSTTITSSIPSTTFTSSTTPSTTIISSTSITSSTPSTTITSSTPSTTITSSTSSTTIASSTTKIANSTPRKTGDRKKLTKTISRKRPGTSTTSISTLVNETDVSGKIGDKIMVVKKQNTTPPVTLDSGKYFNRSIVIEYKSPPKNKNKFLIEYKSPPKHKFIIEYNSRSKNRFVEVQQNTIPDAIEEKAEKKLKKTKKCIGHKSDGDCESMANDNSPKKETTRGSKQREMRRESRIRPLSSNNMERKRGALVIRCRCTSEEIDFIGIRKLVDRNNSLSQKLVWFFALTTSISICIWQVFICLEKFFEKPIGTNVNVEVFNQYRFPAFTMCTQSNQIGPEFDPIVTKLCANHEECSKLNVSARQYFPYAELGTSVMDMWLAKDVKVAQIRVNCMYAVDSSKCKSNESANYKDYAVDLVNGRCATFHSDAEWYYSHSGARTWWMEGVNVNIALARYPMGNVDAYVHSSSIPYKLLVADQNTDRFKTNDIDVTVTEFTYINSSKHPCTTEDELVRCSNRCVEKQFKTLNTSCKTPFLTQSKLPDCKNAHEFNDFHTKLAKLQFLIPKCKCSRACTTISYTTTRMSYENEENKKKVVSTIGIVMVGNVKQIITEHYSYPFTSFLSDLGGSIGLFLGISLFTILELLYTGGSKFLNSYQIKEEDYFTNRCTQHTRASHKML